jgi:2-polyprenyl-3-methyl-5-hydroxy-6-metoxy-1,4-benzoquinol methylase
LTRRAAFGTVAPVAPRGVKGFFDTDAYLRNDTVIPVRARLVGELLGNVTGARLLDVGCGDGSVSAQFLERPNSVTMVDFSERMLERARANATPRARGARVEFVCADLFDLDAHPPYDIVLCIGLLAHVADPGAAVEKVAELVAPAGRCVLQFSDDDQLANRILYRHYARRRHPPYALTRTSGRFVLETLRRVGLRPVATRRYGFVLPGAGKLRRTDLVRLQDLVARVPGVGLQTLVLCEKRP